MIIDYNKPGAWDCHTAVVHREANGEHLVSAPPMIIWLDTDTGDYVALTLVDGAAFYDLDKEEFNRYTGSFGEPVYIMMSNGERLPPTERATDDQQKA